MKHLKALAAAVAMTIALPTIAAADGPVIMTVKPVIRNAIVPLATKPPEPESRKPGTAEERALWQAVDSGDWRRFRELTLRYQRLYPGWQVPDAMLRVRDERKEQQEIKAIVASGDTSAIVRKAEQAPALFSCKQPGNMWALLEAKTADGNRRAAKDMLHSIVKTCKPQERLTAIQKARGLMSEQEILDLIAQPGAKHPEERTNTADIRAVLADRAFGDRVRAFGELVEKAGPGTPAPAHLAAIEARAKNAGDPKLASLLGWWYYRTGALEQAETWFRAAITNGNPPDAEEGLIYVLLERGATAEAEALMMTMSHRLPNETALRSSIAAKRVHSAFAAKQYQACWSFAEEIVPGTPDVWLAKAWCGLEIGQERAALGLFEDVQSDPRATKQQQNDARKGRVVAARRLGDVHYMRHMALEAGMFPPERDRLREEAALAAFLTGYENERYDLSAQGLDELKELGHVLPPDQKILSGWAYFNSGNCGAAWNVFHDLLDDPSEKIATAANEGFQAVNGALEEPLTYCVDKSRR